jgi:Mg2+ and Co2+ transporter CorA
MEADASDIALRCVDVVEWTRGQRPVWVQLALPRLTDDEQASFEGSVDPWDHTQAPTLDWSHVDPVLERVKLAPPSLDRHEQQVLRSLPFLYARGVARVAREVWGREPRPTLRFFPSIAFHPIRGADPPRFRIVRMTVGVIRNVVVTVRLPDLGWNNDSMQFEYQPGDGLVVAERFFPAVDDLSADDVAEAIALQHTSTAQAVTSLVRTRLAMIERVWRIRSVSVAGSSRGSVVEDMGRVIEMTDVVYQLDRQIDRLLRRIEANGGGATKGPTPPEIAMRYRFALDELRSLESSGRLASEALRNALTNQQEGRERFQVVAAMLASAMLIPSLVVGIYGAGVDLPAKHGVSGLIALLVVIAVSAIAGLCLVALWARRR